MKKITFFICSMGSGGAEHQISVLTSMLLRKGYDIELVTFGGYEDHYPIDSRIKRIKIARNSNRLFKFFAIFIFFIVHSTDCIISFGQRENMLALFPLLFRPKVKVIAGERNFTVAAQSKVEKILFKFLYKRADFIVPNSYSQGDYIKSMQPNLSKKVFTITNFTDINQYTYSNPPCQNKIVQVGVFCRYHKQKNYERFAKVLQMLNESNLKIHIQWFGNIQNSLGQYNQDYIRFKSLIEQYNIGNLIQLNDHIKNVKDMMPLFDAICVPSLHEGWSNTISEGICCGRPMLVSDVSDNGRMVKNKENGFLFNPLDEQSMYDAFVEFLRTDYEDKINMGKKSRERACALFDADRFVNSYVKLIEHNNI